MSPRLGLRARLTWSAVAGAAVMLALLVGAFNVLLDARLRSDGDNVLRERAGAVLRGLAIVDGRLHIPEAPDQAATDTKTWIFVGSRAIEQPSADLRSQRAAEVLAGNGRGFVTVEATQTRMEAVSVRQGSGTFGVIVVAASLAPYRSTADSALLGSIILGLLTLGAIAALSGWLMRRALRPVAGLTAEAANWSEHDLSRRFFAGEPHDELSNLASVFDGLLGRLAHSLRREQSLTAEISHELRTPLSRILAEAELAGARERSPAEHRATIELIERHARDLQRVLETLLASARAATDADAGLSDGEAVARAAAEHFREALAAQGRSIEVRSRTPVTVAVGAELVERILAPLLENAARFASCAITVEIGTRAGAAVFEISDDGPGVRPGDQERIFEPGVRTTGSDGAPHTGSGLGLALARRLARSVGGDVQLRAGEQGARFAVSLPLR